MVESTEFERMKEKSKDSLSFLRSQLRFDIGKQRKTKLMCLGELRDKTLLTKLVAERHAERLEKQFSQRWSKFTKREEEERLRFLTVLSQVVPLKVDEAVQATEYMFNRLEFICKGIRGIEVIGVAEIEVVNIGKMNAMASVSDEARKRDVIFDMLPAEEKSLYKSGATSFGLVHFHGIVDVGSGGEENAKKLEEIARGYWKAKHAVNLKRLYSNKTVQKNLRDIARYLTKGGNENLIYKIGFGYDTQEKLDRQLLKSGKAKLEDDYAGFENEMSLTVPEIEFLGQTIDRLMSKTNSTHRNGYVFRAGQQLRKSYR